MTVDAVIAALVSRPDVEGATFLGGEPFDQSGALARVAEGIRATGRSVMVFTGYMREELERPSAPMGHRRLLDRVDLLVDGPFERERPETSRPWVGSTNQRFHALTARYADVIATLDQRPDRLEVTLTADGRILVNGFSDEHVIAALLDSLGRQARRRSADARPEADAADG